MVTLVKRKRMEGEGNKKLRNKNWEKGEENKGERRTRNAFQSNIWLFSREMKEREVD
jgi:hypothetical protein